MSLSVPLQVWIERARSSISKEKYLELAVAIADKLASNLCLVTGEGNTAKTCASFNYSFSSWNGVADDLSFGSCSGSDEKKTERCPPSPLLIKIEDLSPENVLVFFQEVKSGDQTLTAAAFALTEVIIQPADKKLTDVFGTPQPSPREWCFALGKILFEIFSQGSPLLLVDIDLVGNGNASFERLLLEEIALDEDFASPRARKRSSQPNTTADASSTRHLQAKAFLQDQGLPNSICQLVSDLLEAEEGNPYVSDTALLSLEDAQFDLMQMNAHPQKFLHGPQCPKEAIESTALFSQSDGELYGREKEMSVLMDASERISVHVKAPCSLGANVEWRKGVMPGKQFLREAAFLSGPSGSGKSSVIKQFVSNCPKNDWFVLTCKFDRQIAPLSVLLHLFDTFFGKCCVPNCNKAFAKVSRFISSSVDSETFGQLCELLPNLFHIVAPAMGAREERRSQRGSLANIIDKIDTSGARIAPPSGLGSGSNRLNHLFHNIIFKAVLSGGCPVMIILDDLQWADEFTMGIIGDFIQSAGHSSTFSADEGPPKQGLLLVGSFRDNEVEEDGYLMKQIKSMEQCNGIKVTRFSVGELPEREINRMLSSKFCLPMRYTRELAQIVYQKTRGLPMYILEFLRSIIEGNHVFFSVKCRRWTWEATSIDMQIISEGVLLLLARKLQRLPRDVIETLKVASCLGFQVNLSTIQILDMGQFAPDMILSLEVAVKEGIIEKAGPIFAFSHDMLQESTYNLISLEERKLTHAIIGKSIAAEWRVAENAELCMLACDQIKRCIDMDGNLDPVTRASFAALNLAAGKHSVAASSFEQARGYFEAGIYLLHANPWDKQYSLCLELYEMSVFVGFMDGKVEAVSSRLDLILSSVRSFMDSLNTRALQAKLFASQEQHARAAKEMLDVLSMLGEEFPQGACLSHVISEVKAMHPTLSLITKQNIVNLPTMNDAKKLFAMKFMGLLISMVNFSNPTLMSLLSFRMIRLTLEFGFCEESISALVFASHALIYYSGDIQLAGQMCKIAESLVSGNINEQSLKGRLCGWIAAIKCQVEPFQIGVSYCLDGYRSAEIVGDIDSAMFSGLLYCIVKAVSIPDLTCLQRDLIQFMHKTAKYKRLGILHSVMSYYDAVTTLIGNGGSCSIDPKIDMKTDKELFQKAELTQNSYLMHHVIINQISVGCYFREYLHVANLADKHQQNTTVKRSLDFYISFFHGIAALCLARDTREVKWKIIGAKAVEAMADLAKTSTWNYENKLTLLQAELHYTNARHAMAELSYRSAIESAHEHRFFHEEALACELFGIYLVENKEITRGIEQLQFAKDKYQQWGAMKKVYDVKDFIESVCQSAYCWKT